MRHGFKGLLGRPRKPLTEAQIASWKTSCLPNYQFRDAVRHNGVKVAELLEKFTGEYVGRIIDKNGILILLESCPVDDPRLVQLVAYTFMLLFCRGEGDAISLAELNSSVAKRGVVTKEDIEESWRTQIAYSFDEEISHPVGNWLDKEIYWLYVSEQARNLINKNDEQNTKRLS